MRTLRATFFNTSVALAVALPVAWLAPQPSDAAAAPTRERPVASATALVLDGAPVGTLRSASGGNAVGTVVTQSQGPNAAEKKHIASVTYEELALELDLSLGRPIYDWISASWAGKAAPRSGTLTTLDVTGGAGSAREFQNALIRETILPTLDAASKETGFITLLLAPERVTKAAGAKPGGAGTKGKAWLASNFRLEIDGLDTSKVSRVEGLHVKQTIATDSVGARREPTRHAGAIQFDNIKVTLPEVSAESWRVWHDNFVVKGKSSDAEERSGRVLLLAPNFKDELARIELSNVGIVALRPRASSSAAVSQLEAELYVERMSFVLGGK